MFKTSSDIAKGDLTYITYSGILGSVQCDYFTALKKIQRGTAAWLIVPAYRTKYFESQEELYTYVQDELYLTDFEH